MQRTWLRQLTIDSVYAELLHKAEGCPSKRLTGRRVACYCCKRFTAFAPTADRQNNPELRVLFLE